MHKIHVVNHETRKMLCGLEITNKRKKIMLDGLYVETHDKATCSVCRAVIKQKIMTEIKGE